MTNRLGFGIAASILASAMPAQAHGAELPTERASPWDYFRPVDPDAGKSYVIQRDILRCLPAIDGLLKAVKYGFKDYDVSIVDRSPLEFWAILIAWDTLPDVMGHRRGFFEMTIRKEDCWVTSYNFSS